VNMVSLPSATQRLVELFTTSGSWGAFRKQLTPHKDSAILDFARLRGLDEPSGEDVKQLRTELDALKARQGAYPRVVRPWDEEHDDDFVSLRIARDNGSTLINSIKLAFGVFKWELFDQREVCGHLPWNRMIS